MCPRSGERRGRPANPQSPSRGDPGAARTSRLSERAKTPWENVERACRHCDAVHEVVRADDPSLELGNTWSTRSCSRRSPWYSLTSNR